MSVEHSVCTRHGYTKMVFGPLLASSVFCLSGSSSTSVNGDNKRPHGVTPVLFSQAPGGMCFGFSYFQLKLRDRIVGDVPTVPQPADGSAEVCTQAAWLLSPRSGLSSLSRNMGLATALQEWLVCCTDPLCHHWGFWTTSSSFPEDVQLCQRLRGNIKYGVFCARFFVFVCLLAYSWWSQAVGSPVNDKRGKTGQHFCP